MSKKVLLVVAYQGFQPVEYGVTRQLLEDARIDVVVASDKEGVAVASDGSTVDVRYILEDVIVSDYDAIFFIGGSGAMDHLDNDRSYRIIREADRVALIYGGICIATRILANAGVLEWRRVTGWDNDNKLQAILDAAGATYVKTGVVIDNNVITAVGPSHAEDFGQAIIEVLNKPRV